MEPLATETQIESELLPIEAAETQGESELLPSTSTSTSTTTTYYYYLLLCTTEDHIESGKIIFRLPKFQNCRDENLIILLLLFV